MDNKDTNKLVDNLTEKMPQNMLICPFCCEEYLFEFTIKHHLMNSHLDEIMQLDRWPHFQIFCPFCTCMVYYKALLPKHIAFAHSKKTLDEWFAIDDNYQKFQIDKENNHLEPSKLNQLDCSPELSTIFNELNTCDSIKKLKRNDQSVVLTPKSILKKTPHSGRILILSPESVALKRTINNLKRSASARRELRFDLPPLQLSPDVKIESALPTLSFDTPPKKKNFWSFISRRSKSPPPINGKIKKKIREKACKLSNRSANHIITSTPMMSHYPYDSDSDEEGCSELDHSIGSNWKSATKSNEFKPLFLSAERYQCNYCKEKFNSNCELLTHQKEKHKGISFKPAFRCASCGTKFFRNSFLIRHCHNQHTPLKYRN